MVVSKPNSTGSTEVDCEDCKRFEEVQIDRVDKYFNLLKRQKTLLSEGKTNEARELDGLILKAKAEKEAATANLANHRSSHRDAD
jgi:hypothetical protein